MKFFKAFFLIINSSCIVLSEFFAFQRTKRVADLLIYFFEGQSRKNEKKSLVDTQGFFETENFIRETLNAKGK